ncbi:MAG: hypothetical protein U9N54_04135 [candidate division Zixibacteria bacterium]|nr:hypothetical protein [candidate division Zixibacteria bacterium]
MKLFVNLTIILLAIMVCNVSAAETKLNGRLYTNWNLDMTDGAESANSFNVERAYMTIKSKLSDNISARITTDIRETDVDGKTRYDIILKYGYFDWKPKFADGKMKVRFGLHATPYTDVMNKYWGRRYMLKTASDLHKFLTSSDLGAGFILGVGPKGKLGTASIHIFNGTSYSSTTEMNSRKDINAYLSLNPLTKNENLKRSKLHGQVYIGTQNDEIDENEEASAYKKELVSVGGMLGYQKTLDIGFDFNFVTLGEGYNDSGVELDETKSSALSFFSTLYLSDLVEDESFLRNLNFFGRYDMYDPNTDADDDAEKLFVIGAECTPVKGFKASVNYRTESFDDNSPSESGLYVNTLFKF